MLISLLLFLYPSHLVCEISLLQECKQVGYVEICDTLHTNATFTTLYASFEHCIQFLQAHPVWVQKLYIAKEAFLRSKYKNYYATDIFGWYDESHVQGRRQIAFYYSVHFHQFVIAHCPELRTIPAIIDFFSLCYALQQSYEELSMFVAHGLGIQDLFACTDGKPPLLLKLVTYLPSYYPTRPHYDGSAFTLLCDSTDHQSLLVASYQPALTANDFFVPRKTLLQSCDSSSIIVIPGSFITDFSIYPTPHVVQHSGVTRYATIIFAMRPYYTPEKKEFCALPIFNIE